MPIQTICPCGKTLRLRDDLAGMRVKCPECGNAIDVPQVGEDANPFVSEVIATSTPLATKETDLSKPRVEGMTITGKPVNGYNGLYFPTFFGKSELTLGEQRLVEETRKLLSSRYAEFRLREIESAEIVTHRNPVLLVLGLMTLPAYGLGLIFLLAYFLVKYKSLIIHSKSHGAVIGIKGDDAPYYNFLDQVLTAAELVDQ